MDNCTDTVRVAALMMLLHQACAPAVAYAATPDDPRFQATFGSHDPLCAGQLKLLSERPPQASLPVCDIGTVLPPEVQPAEWQELGVFDHLVLLHLIEWQLRYEMSPQPDSEFELWRAKLTERMDSQSNRPQLWRLPIRLKVDAPQEYLYAYSNTSWACNPSSSRTWANYPGKHYFMYDEQRRFVDMLPVPPGHLGFFGGQPYIFSAGLTDKTHYWSGAQASVGSWLCQKPDLTFRTCRLSFATTRGNLFV